LVQTTCGICARLATTPAAHCGLHVERVRCHAGRGPSRPSAHSPGCRSMPSGSAAAAAGAFAAASATSTPVSSARRRSEGASAPGTSTRKLRGRVARQPVPRLSCRQGLRLKGYQYHHARLRRLRLHRRRHHKHHPARMRVAMASAAGCATTPAKVVAPGPTRMIQLMCDSPHTVCVLTGHLSFPSQYNYR
jgi:hypothetical protein